MKKLISIAILLALPFINMASEDSVLFWMLDDPDILNIDGTSSTTIDNLILAGKNIDTVRIQAIDSFGNSTYLSLGNESEGISYADGWGIPDEEGGWSAGPMYASLDGLDLSDPTLRFIMELGAFNDNNEWVIVAIGYETYKSVSNNGHILQSEFSYQGSTPWTGGTWIVPEPNSLVLCILGFCFLGLRRKYFNYLKKK